MRRILTGLALGAAAAGTAYAVTGSSYWTVLVGSVIAVGIWIWPITRDELTDNT